MKRPSQRGPGALTNGRGDRADPLEMKRMKSQTVKPHPHRHRSGA